MLRAALLLTSLAPSAALAPCTAPPGLIPAVSEGLCYAVEVPTNPSGVSIRNYASGNPNATMVATSVPGSYQTGIQGSIAGILNYFSGANDDQRNILSARTVPFIITSSGSLYTARMEISPTQFPDDFLIPRPNQGVALEKVDANVSVSGPPSSRPALP